MIAPPLPPPLHPPRLPPGFPQDWRGRRPASTSALPRLTVVTPSFNQGSYLESTIRSVLSQGYPQLEYFVIDGGSRDSSIDVIRHYEHHLAGWVSEADHGQVDAILKGLRRASGEWFNWINSDDLLAPGALWMVAAATPGADLVAGSTQQFDERGLRGRTVCRQLDLRSLILEQMPSGTRWHQPGLWMRREGLCEVGIDAQSHYRFDYELLLRYLRRYPRVHYVGDTLAWFRLHEQSKSGSLGPRFRVEHIDILRRLAQEPEFVELRGELDLGRRAVEWLQSVDALLAARERPRLQRLHEMLRGVRQDPRARCTRNTRRAARRILLRGGRR